MIISHDFANNFLKIRKRFRVGFKQYTIIFLINRSKSVISIYHNFTSTFCANPLRPLPVQARLSPQRPMSYAPDTELIYCCYTALYGFVIWWLLSSWTKNGKKLVNKGKRKWTNLILWSSLFIRKCTCFLLVISYYQQ